MAAAIRRLLSDCQAPGPDGGRASQDHQELESVSVVGDGHFDLQEDRTTLSADSRKPCQRSVRPRSRRDRLEDFGVRRGGL